MSNTAVSAGNSSPVGVRNGYGTSGATAPLRPEEELTVAFLSLGRLLREQYPARFAEAGEQLGFTVPTIPQVSPWSRIEGDLSDPLGREILAAVAQARAEANGAPLVDEKGE